jgi:hypothetical protein
LKLKDKNTQLKMSHIKIVALFIGIMFGGILSQAQTIELEQDVNQDTVLSKFGKNRKHYVSSYFGFGVTPGQVETDSVQLKSGESTKLSFGFYYKYKVAKPYSILFSLSYGLSQFEFETADDFKYNRLNVNDIELEFANRFNFGKRGNAIGQYLELGISGDYVLATKQQTKQTINDPALNHKTQKNELTGLSYINKPNYTAHARFGSNKFVITADYRLSDLTNDKINFDLPPLTIGLRLDFGG